MISHRASGAGNNTGLPVTDIPRRYLMADWFGIRDTDTLIDLMAELREEGFRPGSNLLDPFAGRGQILFEARQAGFSARGVEMSSMACALASLLTEEPDSVDRVPNAMTRLEGATRATRKFLFSTLCPSCGAEAEVMAYRKVQGETRESKYSCRACKSAGVAQFSEFDRLKEEDIESLTLPIPELKLSPAVEALFTKRNLLALQVLNQGIGRRNLLGHRRILSTALAYTAAMCADLQGACAQGEFLFLNPFQFFPVNVRKILEGLRDARRARESALSGGGMKLTRGSVFNFLDSMEPLDLIITAPPAPGEALGNTYVMVAEAILQLCPWTAEGQKASIAGAEAGELFLPLQAPAPAHFRNPLAWLLAELHKKLRPGGKVIFLLRPEPWVEELYAKALQEAGFTDVVRQSRERGLKVVVDQFALGPRPGPLAGSTVILRASR